MKTLQEKYEEFVKTGIVDDILVNKMMFFVGAFATTSSCLAIGKAPISDEVGAVAMENLMEESQVVYGLRDAYKKEKTQ